MKSRAGRWLPDAARLSYKRRVTAPDGTEMIVYASRKEDADVVGELSWWLPLPIYLAREVISEVRKRKKYEGVWRVTVSRRWGFTRAEDLGEFPKAEALDLVDARAAEIAQGIPRQTS